MNDVAKSILVSSLRREIRSTYIVFYLMTALFIVAAFFIYFSPTGSLASTVFYLMIAVVYGGLGFLFQKQPDESSQKLLLRIAIVFYSVHTLLEVGSSLYLEFYSERDAVDSIDHLSKGSFFVVFMYGLKYVYFISRIIWVGFFFIVLNKFRRIELLLR